MKLTHHSRQKDFKLDNRKYPQILPNMKPNGLWLSVDNGWENWCKSEQPEWIGKDKTLHHFELTDDVNLFVIDSKEKFLDKFDELTKNDEISAELNDKLSQSFILKLCTLCPTFHKKLSKEYDGIYLTREVFYEYRLKDGGFYFYPWDCASICLWNTKKCIEVFDEK